MYVLIHCTYVHTGKPVKVVNGAYRGLRAVMESLNTDIFSVTIRIDQVGHLLLSYVPFACQWLCMCVSLEIMYMYLQKAYICTCVKFISFIVNAGSGQRSSC